MRYPSDLYRGTALDYARFRPPYPHALLASVLRRTSAASPRRLLDLACGTGQIALPLAAHFDAVVAVDQEAGMIDEGHRRAVEQGVHNIHWVRDAAETMTVPGPFALITIGNAFHRLDRATVAARLAPLLATDGCIALLWSDLPWAGDAPWQRSAARTVARWQRRLDPDGARVPKHWQHPILQASHRVVLANAGLTDEGRHTFSHRVAWQVDTLIGFAYSTSMLSRRALGRHAGAFERALASSLLAFGDGPYQQQTTSAYELARRPTQ